MNAVVMVAVKLVEDGTLTVEEAFKSVSFYVSRVVAMGRGFEVATVHQEFRVAMVRIGKLEELNRVMVG